MHWFWMQAHINGVDSAGIKAQSFRTHAKILTVPRYDPWTLSKRELLAESSVG